MCLKIFLKYSLNNFIYKQDCILKMKLESKPDMNKNVNLYPRQFNRIIGIFEIIVPSLA